MIPEPQPRKLSKLEWSVLAVLFVSVILSFFVVPTLAGDGLLHVWFLDVGQGDAILTVGMLYTHSYLKLSSLT